MDKAHELAIILKLLEVRGVRKLNFLDKSFPVQYACSQDRSKQKAIQCTRRAGKSTGEKNQVLQLAHDFPRSKHLIFGLTLGSAKNIYWDMFQETLDQKKVLANSNATTGEIRLRNNSLIKLYGLDASYKQLAKVLGSAYKTVKIDEAGSITQNLEKFCYQMVRPALMDQAGTLTLLGTAENIPNTFFEKVTSGKEQGWQVYKWTTQDNPYMKDKWIQELAWIKENNPAFMETSEFRTHYLNEWCADDQMLIIKVMDHTVIEPKPLAGFNHVLSIDLGYSDSTAFVVGAYSPSDPTGYIAYAYKETGMDFTDVANKIKELRLQFPIQKFVIDGANKQGVEEIRKRHGIPLSNAEKTDKNVNLRLLKDDVIQGRIKVFSTCDELINEWKTLQWKDKMMQEEDPRCENHLNDATLYAWREMRNYIQIRKPVSPDPNSDEFMKQYEKDLMKRIQKARRS